MFVSFFTFRIRQSCVGRLSAVAASVSVAGQAAISASDERLPVRLDVDRVGRPGSVQNVLDSDDLVQLRLRDVDRLPLLELVAVGAVGQVEPVVDAAWAENKIKRISYETKSLTVFIKLSKYF